MPAHPETAAVTHVGAVRQLNEDSWTTVGEPLILAAVADGMGGHEAGEVASAAAVETLRRRAPEALAAGTPHTPEDLGLLVHEADRAVVEAGGGRAGTTLTVLACLDTGAGRWAVANVGDSRVYLRPVGTPVLQQLTVDHSAVQMLVDAGELTPAEARVHPRRNVITRALGSAEPLVVDVAEIDVTAGDTILLCSDGLTGELTDEEIRAVIDDAQDLPSAAERLVEAALWRGGRDNITAVLVRIP
ncbi:PP2C family protein-serine/threonine phosphatase [Micrococcus sp.]|uniref:PP2C family protein-serine/threonine phosphatase n=1 Tax=Micrococcus sp. TaxID=1271 RepID=UPI002A91CBBC|nr:protein phosphatase 2C domain-containing protein [Micrococcus sp.]MDY6054843.1 protein phosphatase 2C domain-containing protein [Micrococcus sp.]